jgi:NUMOD3 motif
MANAESMWVVYWLKDESCICLWRHGYIGYSSCLRDRLKYWRVHQPRWRKPFEYEVLFVGTKKECRTLEYKLRPERFIGWNYLAGGGKSPREGVIIAEYIRQRMSEAAKKKPPISAATREKLRIAHTGRTNRGRLGQKKSFEERAKIAQSQRGKKRSEEYCEKLSARMMGTAHHLGHMHTDETKQRIRMKKTGVPIHSDGHKRKLAERMKGNTFTKGKPWSAARRIAWLQRKEA